MRTSMKFIIVTGEVLLFGLLAVASVRGAEFPPIKPTYLVASHTSASSPYASAQPVRVTMVNKDGQVSTLEYRQPDRVVDEGPLVSINSLPARELDLPTSQDIRPIGYQYQANYPSAPSSVPIVRTANCNQPAVVNYAPPTVTYPPATQYTMPNYAVPVTGVPQTVYRPLVPVAPAAPALQSNLQVGTGIYGQPVIYRPGQPVRNAWRWLTP